MLDICVMNLFMKWGNTPSAWKFLPMFPSSYTVPWSQSQIIRISPGLVISIFPWCASIWYPYWFQSQGGIILFTVFATCKQTIIKLDLDRTIMKWRTELIVSRFWVTFQWFNDQLPRVVRSIRQYLRHVIWQTTVHRLWQFVLLAYCLYHCFCSCTHPICYLSSKPTGTNQMR